MRGSKAVRSVTRLPRKKERGVALVTALLLLALLTGMSIAMFLAANSDELTNGYYKNFRGSYYAADSGLTIVRQDLKNKLWSSIGSADQDTPPYAAGVESTILSQLKTQWASSSDFKAITNGSALADTVPASFRIDPNSLSLSLVKCYTDTNANTCAGVTNASEWNYVYNYHMVAIGKAGLAHQNKVEESGTLTVHVPITFKIPDKFFQYGLYIQKQPLCPSGSSGFAPGTIYGPVYTENCFTFGTNGQVTFKDKVGCGGAAAGYQFGSKTSTCVQKADTWAKQGNTTIKPDFQQGLYFNVEKQDLPENSYSQKQAILDGQGDAASATWSADATAKLKDASKSQYKGSNGVYVPVNQNGAIEGGGIFVSGDAGVTLSTATAVINGTACVEQIYTIVVGGTTTTVTVANKINPSWKADQADPHNPPYVAPGEGWTTIQTGSKSNTFTGVPAQMSNQAGTLVPVESATMLYVQGNVTSLSGQVQDGTALTITSEKDVTITGDVKYKTKPVTTQDNEVVSGASPACCNTKDQKLSADSVIPGNDRGQALGIFTAGGDIYTSLKNSGNMEIDASLATISVSGDGGLKIPDSSAMINNLTILGGRIHNSIYSTSKLGSRNVLFDRRFGGDFGPPFFPSTHKGKKIQGVGDTTVEIHRQQWVNQTAY